MNMLPHRFILIFVFVFQLFAVHFCLEAPTINLNNYGNCEDDEKNSLHLHLNISKTAFNQYKVNGEFTLEEILDSPIEVLYE